MAAPSTTDALDDLPLAWLRGRRSAKWRTYPEDVLPAWVAEMDFPLAPAVHRTLAEALDRHDCGYPQPAELPEAFAAFAEERFGWTVAPERVTLVADTMTGVAELLRGLTEPGDGVVVNPPVYPPFFGVVAETGRRLVEAPLAPAERGHALDLDAVERAFASGASAYLLCNPHNPTGRVHRREELEAVAALAARHGVLVVSDEIHAPLTLPGAAHTPWLTLGDEAAAWGVTLSSASKAWNVAGLKCALVVAGSDEMQERLAATLPPSLRFHAGHLGVLAAVAAFREGGEWLDRVLERLDGNRALLTRLLERELPEVGCVPPEAGYLAWLDCRALGLGDDPAATFLELGRVALSPGVNFGEPGRGFVRLNIGTSSALVEEAVRRMARALAVGG